MRTLWLFLVCATGAAASDGAGLSPAELKQAIKLDKRKCYRCHKPYDPKDYSVEEWEVWMDKMSRKARLKERDEALLRRYFDAKRGSSTSLSIRPERSRLTCAPLRLIPRTPQPCRLRADAGSLS